MMIKDSTFGPAAEQLMQAGRFLYGQGWSPATSSNYSVRLGADTAAITASGRHKGQLMKADILAIDLQGKLLEVEGTAFNPDEKSSAETALHTGLYRRYPDIGAVLHTHSPAATILSKFLQKDGVLVVEDYEMQKALTGRHTHETELAIPIFPNTQDIDALAEDVDGWLNVHPDCVAYLIAGHGLYTWASDMRTCLRHIEALEFICSCELELMKLFRKQE
ncbi:methylthioribulose 1-phosphate dehydratase [Allohahella marinimesophila]|uniref:Methylthioribulose-1-phosphate dehydratase n=1 Tax=Allohahella marinimesophila TaxID=1054972 RepID=A0ABP7PRT0_9GAMM